MALVKGGASYALAAESSDRNEAMPRLYFLAWGLGPFVPKVHGFKKGVLAMHVLCTCGINDSG